jgi:hypothetical protein
MSIRIPGCKSVNADPFDDAPHLAQIALRRMHDALNQDFPSEATKGPSGGKALTDEVGKQLSIKSWEYRQEAK